MSLLLRRLRWHTVWHEPGSPIWGEQPAELLREVVARGFDARLVCVDLARLPRAWLGRKLDERACAALSCLPASTRYSAAARISRSSSGVRWMGFARMLLATAACSTSTGRSWGVTP